MLMDGPHGEQCTVAVYAICKNESKHVETFMQWAKHADHVYILDTGSTDDTVALFNAHPHVTVHTVDITPWRFDEARQRNLEMVPHSFNVCVNADLDERYNDGWCDQVRQVYHEHMERYHAPRIVMHTYVHPNGLRDTKRKIHTRRGWMWKYAVHEDLFPEDGSDWHSHPGRVVAKDIVLVHTPDTSKSRAQYTPMLEITVREHPEATQHMFWLLRDLVFQQRWREFVNYAMPYLTRYKSPVPWNVERAQTCLFMAAFHRHTRPALERFLRGGGDSLGDEHGETSPTLDTRNYEFREQWLMRAVAEAPNWLEIWAELAHYYAQRGMPTLAHASAKRALDLRVQVGDSCGHYLCNQKLHEHEVLSDFLQV